MSVAELQRVLGSTYRIERELGSGGMATVYLARDPKHERPVAIKVLRPELAAIVGGERFLKEIRTTANLQHPHILPLHDSGVADGLIYYVMPFIEGESLRQRLQREKQLPVDESVRIAREVAGGLDYAHRHGVVHRDIKPENILLHDGQALVADFGIALAVSRSDGSTRMTETGMSLGTPNYMSPEQAMGEREITPRSDVYALGCVLYEMLVGEPPFTGPTPQAIFARVLTDEPRALSLQRRTIPPHVDAAILTALSKVPADRFATAAQFADALASPGYTTASRSVAAVRPARRTRERVVLAGAGVALAAAGAIGMAVLTPRPPAPHPARVSLRVFDNARLTFAPLATVAISPDGSRIVYAGEGPSGLQLFQRRLDDLAVAPIAGTEGAFSPMFSPDGQWISFVTGATVRKVPVGGGSPVTVGAISAIGVLFDKSSEGFLATAPGGALVRFRADGSTEEIARPDSAEAALVPTDLMPDGRIVVVTQQQGLTGAVWIVDPDNGKRTLVTRQLAGIASYHDGFFAWVLPSGALVAAPWDDRRGVISGATEVLAPNVRIAPGAPPQIAFSRSGSLVYVPAQPSELVRVDRAGVAQPVTAEPRRFHSPRVSPDGSRIAVDITDERRDVWTLLLRDGTLTRQTFDNDGHDPTWLPDGRSILYHTSRGATVGVHRRRLGSATPSDSIAHGGLQMSAHTVSPDGAFAIATDIGPAGDFNLVKIHLATGKLEPIAVTSFSESDAALSPNARWLAYTSDESGRTEVYLMPLADPSARMQVSLNGGTEVVWSRNGRELFYREPTGPLLVAATIETTPELRVGGRTPLFNVSDYESASPHANYDVTADGKFIAVRNARAVEMVLIQNWAEILKGRAERR